MKIDSPTLLSILTNYGIDIATEIEQGVKLNIIINKRIKKLKQDKIGDFHYEINMLETLLKESKNES